MANDEPGQQQIKAGRRAFLEQCGRFAVVTPPVVTLMLATDGTRRALAASGASTITTTMTATTSTTATTGTTVVNTVSATATQTTTSVTTTFTTTTTTTTATVLPPIGSLEMPSNDKSELAMMVDSMGVMKAS